MILCALSAAPYISQHQKLIHSRLPHIYMYIHFFNNWIEKIQFKIRHAIKLIASEKERHTKPTTLLDLVCRLYWFYMRCKEMHKTNWQTVGWGKGVEHIHFIKRRISCEVEKITVANTQTTTNFPRQRSFQTSDAIFHNIFTDFRLIPQKFYDKIWETICQNCTL